MSDDATTTSSTPNTPKRDNTTDTSKTATEKDNKNKTIPKSSNAAPMSSSSLSSPTFIIAFLVLALVFSQLFLNFSTVDDTHDKHDTRENDVLDDQDDDERSFRFSKSVERDQHVIAFEFCTSCGYRNAFVQFSTRLRDEFPDLKITEANYAPAAWKSFLSQLVTILKFAVIGILVANYDPFTSFFGNLTTPPFMRWMLDHKLYCGAMMFFIGNAITQNLISTGAFEVMLDGKPIWSKLESGRMPQLGELFMAINEQIKVSI